MDPNELKRQQRINRGLYGVIPEELTKSSSKLNFVPMESPLTKKQQSEVEKLVKFLRDNEESYEYEFHDRNMKKFGLEDLLQKRSSAALPSSLMEPLRTNKQWIKHFSNCLEKESWDSCNVKHIPSEYQSDFVTIQKAREVPLFSETTNGNVKRERCLNKSLLEPILQPKHVLEAFSWASRLLENDDEKEFASIVDNEISEKIALGDYLGAFDLYSSSLLKLMKEHRNDVNKDFAELFLLGKVRPDLVYFINHDIDGKMSVEFYKQYQEAKMKATYLLYQLESRLAKTFGE